MYEKMLIPLDGSEIAEQILPYATELAKRCGSHVTLIQVVESLGQAMAGLAPAEPGVILPQTVENLAEGVESQEEAARAYLTRIAAQLSDRGIGTDWVLASGTAGDEINRYAVEQGIDVIAISSHGRGGVARALLGSVADDVVRHARGPVLVLRYHGTA